MGDKILKLSDALKLGATFRPQIKQRYFKDGGSCAMGAILETIGLEYKENDEGIDLVYIVERLDLKGWRHLLKQPTECPACHCKHNYYPDCNESVYSIIVVLNNLHNWTREQIADWLRSINL